MKKKPFTESIFHRGMNEAVRALRSYARENTAGGVGFYIRLWPDGSGELIRESAEDETLVFSFSRPAELWDWLHADPEQREFMEGKSQQRQREEQQRLRDYVAKGKLQ